MTRQNALWNCKNPHQGDFPKVLCVCSAGLLRSPTIAFVLSNRGFNTRAAGIHDYALIRVDEVLVEWADTIVFAEQEHYNICKDLVQNKEVFILNVPDQYEFRDPVLIKEIEKALEETTLK